jgi:diadenylate cyclase
MVWEFLKVTWRPAVEVLILAVGIYFPLMYLRKTRGWPIVLGLIVILSALTGIAILLNLEVIKWLLRYFYAGFALAVLIIFQPELRRMFAELGRFPLFVTAREERQHIEVVVQAAERLAEMRIGALIAIQDNTPLDDYLESGVVIDCQASPEMLETVFFPNNAIHDGGVIIRGDRIAKAACIFPLTTRQDLSRSLGTRHRAAIGLSEETDAAIVVVSEETGAVSYAHRGQLTRNVTVEELRAFLTSVFISPAPEPTSPPPPAEHPAAAEPAPRTESSPMPASSPPPPPPVTSPQPTPAPDADAPSRLP